MADYKVIKGFGIQSIAGDPTFIIGQAWYDNVANAFQVHIESKAWAEGNNLNTGRTLTTGGGTQTAGIQVAGGVPPGVQTCDLVEEYDGTSYSEVTELSALTNNTSFIGTQTAGMQCSGNHRTAGAQKDTEEYNGASWSNGGDQNIIRNSAGCCAAGTQTAGLLAGGYQSLPSPAGDRAQSEEYNGASWTEGNELNTARAVGGSGGRSDSAAITFGGYKQTAPTGTQDITEEYNGASWAETGDLNTGRSAMGGAGDQSSALGYGDDGHSTAVEEFDGTTWATATAMNTSRGKSRGQSYALASAMVAAGGEIAGGMTDNSEEYTVSQSAKTITVS
jgi:hypothetical protein